MEQIRFNRYEHDLVDFAKSHRRQQTKAESLFRGIVVQYLKETIKEREKEI